MAISVVAYIPGEKLYRGATNSLSFLAVCRRAEIIVAPPDIGDYADFQKFDLFKKSCGLNFKIEEVKSQNFPLITVPNIYFFVAHHSLTFYKPHKKSPSPDSNAIYLAEDQSNGLILQYLFPRSHTSDHSHQPKETFYTLYGQCFCFFDGKERFTLDNTKDALVVSPHRRHQLKTENSYALNLLLLEGGLSSKNNCRYYRAT